MNDLYDRIARLEEMLADVHARQMNAMSRGTLESTEDKDGIQGANVRGLAGEKLEGVRRVETFGLSSHAPAGSDVFMVSLNGDRTQVMILGSGTKDKRPTQSPEGSTTLYDASGSTIAMDNAGNITITCAAKLTIKAADVEITSSTLTNNGVDISDKHRHQDVAPGPTVTGVPVGG